MAIDAYGLPIQFDMTGGQVHDCKIAPEFIAQLLLSSTMRINSDICALHVEAVW